MDPATGWTGRTACALQAALRLSNETFAEQLGIGVRTVASWHQKPSLRPRPDMQQILDTALDRAPAAVKARFAVLAGDRDRADGPPAAEARTPEDDTTAEAERRLGTDPHIAAALDGLDQFQPVHLRHLQIADDGIRHPALHRFERFSAVGGIADPPVRLLLK